MNFDHVRSSGNIALHFNALTEKVDEVAARAGVSSVDRMDLEQFSEHCLGASAAG